ncbi:Hsp20 family protein [bacterium]|nr:Hsp20 family protein [bacterium]
MADELKKRRQAKDLAQEKLARKLGISRQTLHSLETGKCKPSLVLLAKIENFFQTSWRDLFPNIASQYPLAIKKQTNQNNKEGFMRRRDFEKFFDFHFPHFKDFFALSWPEVWEKMGFVARVNLVDKGSFLELLVDLPGFKKDETEVEVMPREVLVRAKRREEKREKAKGVYYNEATAAEVSRRIALPSEIDPDKSKAELKDGRLRVVLPKLKSQESRTIKPE